MNDDPQRIDEIRRQLRRIHGHKELSPKQDEASLRLARELVSLTADRDRLWEELQKIFEDRK